MRLWDRIRDYVLLIVFLFISLSVLLSVKNNALLSLRSFSLELTSGVEGTFSWVGHYFNALRENDALRQNNINLSSRLSRLLEQEIANKRLRKMLGFRDSTITKYTLVPADIINRDVTRSSNLLTLNVGSNENVALDMPVITDRGLIGKIITVSPRYSQVLPYLNKENFKVAGKIHPRQIFGIIQWEGNNPNRLTMNNVLRTEKISKGDTIVTAGSPYGFYPPGIPIGYVDTTFVRPGSYDLSIYLHPVAPLTTTEHVFVVLAQKSQEQQNIELRGEMKIPNPSDN
jgi:rod shape-determining protein MreC